MAGFRRGAVLAATAAMALGGLARAQAPQSRLEAYYLEAPPERAGRTAAALRVHAAQLRRDPRLTEAQVLREAGRPGRLALVEIWRDHDAAGAAAETRALEEAAGQALQAPVDDRLGDPAAPLDPAPTPAGAVHVLIHIDVVPDGAGAARKALVEQRAAARAAPGNLRFEVAAQAGRPNHFTVWQAWRSRAAYEAWNASPPAKALRTQLNPFKGALYDDRLYLAD